MVSKVALLTLTSAALWGVWGGTSYLEKRKFDNYIKASTNYEQNIAQLKGELTSDEFDAFNYAAKAVPEPYGMLTHFAEYNATEQVAKALKGAPKDSIGTFFNRALATLAKSK